MRRVPDSDLPHLRRALAEAAKLNDELADAALSEHNARIFRNRARAYDSIARQLDDLNDAAPRTRAA